MIARLTLALDGLRLGRTGHALSLMVVLLSGCDPGDSRDTPIVSLSPPPGWSERPLTDYSVPGEPLAAWSGPDRSSIVVFRTLPVPYATASRLARGEVGRFEAYPGASQLRSQVITLPGGLEAGRIEAVAPGTGDALTPPVTGLAVNVDDPGSAEGGQSLVPTRRITIVLPDPSGPIWIYWHFPESAHESMAPQVDAMIRTLSLERR